MAEQLKIGDVVSLKSGGPNMTITYITEGGDLECSWFTKDGRDKDTFRADALQKSNPGGPKAGVFHVG